MKRYEVRALTHVCLIVDMDDPDPDIHRDVDESEYLEAALAKGDPTLRLLPVPARPGFFHVVRRTDRTWNGKAVA